jgi:hypothetical protein
MPTARADLKFGFFLGLGLVLASMVIAFLQLLTLRAVHRNG